MYHPLLKKLGYGMTSLCFVHCGIVYVKKKENVAYCEASNIRQHNGRKYQLLDVHVFFRHGARTPIKHLPGIDEVVYDSKKWTQVPSHTDIPYTVETPDGKPRPDSRLEQHYQKICFKGGMIAGSLTSIGRQQAYELGQRLRKRYMENVQFVRGQFNTEDVAIRSTNVERCIQSLRSVLAGMYGKESFKEKVIIHVVPLEAEILFPNTRFCDTLRKLDVNVPEYLQQQHGFQFISHYIKHFTKQNDDTPVPMMYWRDHLVARKTHGLEVPLWLEAVEEDVTKWATKSLELFMCGVPQDRLLALQLSAGPMLNLVKEQFEARIKNPNGPRLHLYSAHDSTIMPLIVSLGISDHQWPPFCSDVTLELYRSAEKEYFVKISYNGEDFTFPGYDTPMLPFHKFKEMISPFVIGPSQYMQRCHDMDLAREHAQKWEAVLKAHEQEEKDEENYEFPPNM